MLRAPARRVARTWSFRSRVCTLVNEPYDGYGSGADAAPVVLRWIGTALSHRDKISLGERCGTSKLSRSSNNQ